MKNRKLIALICLLGIFFTSCNKEPKTEWKDFYNYTNADIIGTYVYSNVSNAFDEVEGTGRHVCPDAQVNIRASNEHPNSWIKFSVNCENEGFSRSFEGVTTPNEDDHMIRMTTGYIHAGGKINAYNVAACVLKNEKQEIRLHGFVAKITYEEVTNEETGVVTYNQTDGEYYYFDVIKN